MRKFQRFCDLCGVEITGAYVEVRVRGCEDVDDAHVVRRVESFDLCTAHGPSAGAVAAWLMGWASNVPPGPVMEPHAAAVTLVSRELGGTGRTVLAASVLAGLLRVAPITVIDDLVRLVSRYGDSEDRELVHELMQLVKAKRAEQGATIGDDAPRARGGCADDGAPETDGGDVAPTRQDGSGWWEP